MFTCYQCGKLIRAKMVRTSPSHLPYHPACYEKAERDAARILKQKAADWQGKDARLSDLYWSGNTLGIG
jgi:hypothetical protein